MVQSQEANQCIILRFLTTLSVTFTPLPALSPCASVWAGDRAGTR